MTAKKILNPNIRAVALLYAEISLQEVGFIMVWALTPLVV